MGRKKNGHRAPAPQPKASTAAGPPGSQAAGSKNNCDDAKSGSDATRLLLIEEAALAQKSDIFFYSPRPPKTQRDENQPFHLPPRQFARPHLL